MCASRVERLGLLGRLRNRLAMLAWSKGYSEGFSPVNALKLRLQRGIASAFVGW